MSELARLGCGLEETSSTILPVSAYPTGGYEKGEVVQVNTQWGFIFSWASDDEADIRYAPSVLLITKARVVVGQKAAVAIAKADKIYWNNSSQKFTNVSSGGGVYFGRARQGAAETDSEVEFEFDRTGDL